MLVLLPPIHSSPPHRIVVRSKYGNMGEKSFINYKAVYERDRMHQKQLVECLAFSRCAINGSYYDTVSVALRDLGK